MLEAVADILTTIANGAMAIGGDLLGLRAILLILSAVSLFWLAAVDLEALDRRAYKPTTRPH